MSFDTKSWDCNQLTISLAGLIIASGWADGEVVTVEQESDNFGDKVGTDGEVARFKTNDRRATITFKLMQTSDENVKLSALANLDLAGGAGAGIGPLVIKDRSGTSLYEADKAWIAKPPNVSFDREPKEREWKIRCSNLRRLDGGN